ncbi:hypothetical protein ACLI4Q_16965 [Natrialbaceae archaeon A-CW1-1]
MARKQPRRSILKAAGAAGMVAIAGCMGDDDGNGNGNGDGNGNDAATPDDDYWPPPRDQIEIISPQGPGSTVPEMSSMWLQAATNHMSGDIRGTVTYSQGGEGMIAAQDLYNAPGDGSVIGGQFILDLANAAIELDTIDYEDYRWFANYFVDLFGIQISHHSRDIEDHFEWTWPDLVEAAEEEPLNLGVSMVGHQIITEYVMQNAPGIDDDMYQIISFDGGGPIREGMLSGDLDGRFVSATSSYPTDRTEFSKLQIVLGDPEQWADLAEELASLPSGDGLQESVPEEAWLSNQDYPGDAASDISSIFADGIVNGAPPDMPDETLAIFEDAYSEAADDEDRRDSVVTAFGEMRDLPTIGEDEVSEIVNNTIDTALNDDLFLELVDDL